MTNCQSCLNPATHEHKGKPKAQLSEDQQNHLDSIIKEFSESVTTKYIKGQQEHGGNLWLKSGLIEMALEEVYDMAVYLITLREQLKDHFAESSEKFLVNKGG